MKVIILAAGMGSRMGDLTKDEPKCFLNVYGKTLIERLINQLRNLGLKDISIVTGYKAKKFKFNDINFFYNKEFKTSNMVYSLMKAKKKLNDETLIIYSDIIVSNKILKKMISKRYNNKLSVAVDTNWKKYWAFRFKNINQDLESLQMNNKKEITELGKELKNIKDIDGRFIGIIRFPKNINKSFLKIWNKEKNKNKKNWGISGRSLKKAYMTDLLNKLINLKIKCKAVLFKNGWYEFDNKKDYYQFKRFKLLNL
jgi:L-glutamine-phosphate cytidylyltransferase